MISIYMLSPSQAVEKWPEIEKLINMTLPYAGGEHSIEDIKTLIFEGQVIFHLVYEDNQLIGGFSVELMTYPQKTIMNIPTTAGKDIHKWIDMAINSINDLAKLCGATEIRTRGRKGWGKMLPDFKHEYTILSRTVI